jgi:hypothetical protein
MLVVLDKNHRETYIDDKHGEGIKDEGNPPPENYQIKT